MVARKSDKRTTRDRLIAIETKQEMHDGMLKILLTVNLTSVVGAIAVIILFIPK